MLSIPRVSFLLAFLLAGFAFLEHHDSATRMLCNEASLLRNAWSCAEARWSRIGPQRPLIVGKQPLQELDDVARLRALGVTRVFDLTEPDEWTPGLFYTPTRHAGWFDIGGTEAVAWYPIPDHAPLSPAHQLHDQVRRMEAWISQGHLVYVHCRAGVGRSASLAVAYLMHSERLSFSAAYAELRLWRPQVDLNAAQQAALRVYGDWLDLWSLITLSTQ